MNQESIDQAIEDIKNYYFPTLWQSIVDFYGEETAAELDFTDDFEFDEVYRNGTPAECEIFHKLASMQRAFVYNLFNVAEDDEAMFTVIVLEYWIYKLFDKATGVGNHNAWLH